MNCERGQATAAALLLMPIAVLLVTTLILLGFAFIFEANATALCRGSLGQSQAEARQALEKLLALNPKAQKLETARQSAILNLEAALATGDAAFYAAAKLALVTIEQAQVPVMVAQLRWLTKGRASSLGAADRAEASIHEALPEVITRKATTVPTLTRARFEVLAEGPAGARTPTYRTAPGFEQSQRAEVRWLLTLPQTSNETELSPSINIGCAMTLTKKGVDKWSPQVLEDKLLPN